MMIDVIIIGLYILTWNNFGYKHVDCKWKTHLMKIEKDKDCNY